MDTRIPRRSWVKRLTVAVGSSVLAAATLVSLPSARPAQAQAAYVQRVRVGSNVAFTDSAGNVWSGDRAYSPGAFGYTQGGYLWSTSATIANTPDTPLFQNNRHDATVTYRFDVPNGTYQVRLRFAEIYPNSFGAGRRVFNVAIGGTPVLQNFDVYALAGGNAALDRTFTSSVTNNALTITLTGVVSQPAISAIEVLSTGGSQATATPTSTATRTPTSTATAMSTATATQTPPATVTPVATFTATSVPSPSPTSLATLTATSTPVATSTSLPTASPTPTRTLVPLPSSTPTLVPTATAVPTQGVPVSGPLVRRIRAGGAVGYTDGQGNQWSADHAYTVGGYGYVGGTAYSSTAVISGTTDGPLYQANRHDTTFHYRFDLPNGTYVVRLGFAEIYPLSFGAGRRVQNVAIQNATVLQNLDVFVSAGGGNIAVDRSFTATVSNGTLDIAFTGVVSSAAVNLIEVASAVTTPDFTFTTAPLSQTMGLTSTAQFSATVQMTGGFSPNGISLWVTGLPAGVTASFTPNPLPHEGTAELFITADGTAAPGTYPFVIGATADNVTHAQSGAVVLSSQTDFSMASTPLSQTISAGGPDVTFQVALTAMNGMTDPVMLSTAGLPAGVTATFSPNPIVPGQATLMTLHATPSTGSGQYGVSITGTSGSGSRATQVQLTVASGTVWAVSPIGTTGTENNSMRVGAGRSDGVNRLYVGTVTTGRVIEYTWNGTGWSNGVDIGGSPSGVEIHNLGIGPGRNDGVNRVYACSLDANLYELSYVNGGWVQATVGSSVGYCTHAAVGPGRTDGVDRLYATRGLYVFEYTWSPATASWDAIQVGRIPTGLAHGISIGTGRGGSTNHLYVATTNSGTYEASFESGSWILESMGDSGDVRNVSPGNGRNDGVMRVYAATQSGEMREFTWTGTRWTFAPMVTPFGFTLVHAYVAAGRNDGVMHVYSSGETGSAYEFTWNGSRWVALPLGGGTGYAYGFHLGQGRNDGRLRLYGASFDRLVYEYTFGS